MEGKIQLLWKQNSVTTETKINDIKNISSHRPTETNPQASNFAGVC
jgi:hypothetical protein